MRKVKIKLIFLCLLLAGWDNPLSRTLTKKTQQGNQYYKQNQFDKALKAYTEAQLAKPDSPELHFNIGDVLYKQKKYQEAMAEYQKVLTDERGELKAKAFYNIGNSFYKLDQYQEAVGSYQKTLEIDPEDLDAKTNLEFVQKKLEQQQQQDKQQKEQEKEQKQQKDEKGDSESSDQDKDKKEDQQKSDEKQDKDKDKEKEEQQQADKEKDEEKQEKNEEKKRPKPDEGMSKEDAERLLDALEDDEKEVQRALRKPTREIHIEKDW